MDLLLEILGWIGGIGMAFFLMLVISFAATAHESGFDKGIVVTVATLLLVFLLYKGVVSLSSGVSTLVSSPISVVQTDTAGEHTTSGIVQKEKPLDAVGEKKMSRELWIWGFYVLFFGAFLYWIFKPAQNEAGRTFRQKLIDTLTLSTLRSDREREE